MMMHVELAHITEQVRIALQEDLGSGDVTAALLEPSQQAKAQIIAREPGVICGTEWVNEVFRQIDPNISIQWHVADKDLVSPDHVLCYIEGPTHALLSAERTALNFLQTLSGTATITHRYIEAMGPTETKLLDTRKTIPGLRLAQKYAVHCGGGHNHRIGLYDMILIKENHIASHGSIAAVLTAAQQNQNIAIEIEVENLDELEQALAAGATRILLDNFDTTSLRKAVTLTAGRAKLEASGNITLANIQQIAETGVDYISIGALTKHIQALDLSMRLIA